MADKINTGILTDPSVVRPRNLTQYKAFRGITDFTQIGQFDQFETGYSFLSVLGIPRYLQKIGEKSDSVKNMVDSFVHMLEFEFRGLSGLPDIQGATGTITDGINEVQYINKVTMDTSISVSMPYYEKQGSLIEKFTEYYLTGIKDKNSQAKTYHGLIKSGLLEPSLENEVFTLMYMVTDNTYTRLEKAVLLCNAQLVSAEQSMYDSTHGDIGNREVNISFNCFPITGVLVNKAAKSLLENITGSTYKVKERTPAGESGISTKKNATSGVTFDTAEYNYSIIDKNSENIGKSGDNLLNYGTLPEGFKQGDNGKW